MSNKESVAEPDKRANKLREDALYQAQTGGILLTGAATTSWLRFKGQENPHGFLGYAALGLLIAGVFQSVRAWVTAGEVKSVNKKASYEKPLSHEKQTELKQLTDKVLEDSSKVLGVDLTHADEEPAAESWKQRLEEAKQGMAAGVVK